MIIGKTNSARRLLESMNRFTRNQIAALRLARQGKTPADIQKLKSIPASTAYYALESATRKIDQAIELLRYAAEIDCLNKNQVKKLKGFLQKV
jgi:hypothetical protein